MAIRGISQVIGNINRIYDRKVAATYALCLKYAAEAINYFRAEQSNNRFWNNQSGQARDRMFTDAILATDYVSWFMAHGVQYGVYLELANDGRNESIRPVIRHFLPQFKRDVEKIWGHQVA